MKNGRKKLYECYISYQGGTCHVLGAVGRRARHLSSVALLGAHPFNHVGTISLKNLKMLRLNFILKPSEVGVLDQKLMLRASYEGELIMRLLIVCRNMADFIKYNDCF
jgi:hypothetical protein